MVEVLSRFRSTFEGGRIYLGRRPAGPLEPVDDAADWIQANPKRIERALERALKRPTGGWYVVCASREVDQTPRAWPVAGRTLVVWRAKDQVLAAPESCPHMGASLDCAAVADGGETIVCPWHALRLGRSGHGPWRHVPAWDDGVLVWVRLPEAGQEPAERPILPLRPASFMDAVVRVEGACEPRDIIANRLDPWHGAHFHPYAFAALTVFEADDDILKMRVEYRVAGPVVMEVDVSFHSPDPRTIVMTILQGDGAGSVVETHATPLSDGRTAMIEATLATSDRGGFRRLLPLKGLLRPFIAARARRLWVDDMAYAERLARLRTNAPDVQGGAPGVPARKP